MKTVKKAILLVLCAALLVCASVMGTMAYLTSQASVKNTFTVGKVTITMDEAKVNEYGEKLNSEGNVFVEGDTLASRVTSNAYKLIPGHEYVKDPIIHVQSDSEACWLFVKVENGLGANATINGLQENGWKQIGDTNYWAYHVIVGSNDKVQVFDSFTYSFSVTDTTADANKEITVTAYAIQANGFATYAEAWTALKGQLNLE